MKLPQFSLRDLLWLVPVAACLFGWWRSESGASAERQTLSTDLDAPRRESAEWRWRAETLKEWLEDRSAEFRVTLEDSGVLYIDDGKSGHYIPRR